METQEGPTQQPGHIYGPRASDRRGSGSDGLAGAGPLMLRRTSTSNSLPTSPSAELANALENYTMFGTGMAGEVRIRDDPTIIMPEDSESQSQSAEPAPSAIESNAPLVAWVVFILGFCLPLLWLYGVMFLKGKGKKAKLLGIMSICMFSLVLVVGSAVGITIAVTTSDCNDLGAKECFGKEGCTWCVNGNENAECKKEIFCRDKMLRFKNAADLCSLLYGAEECSRDGGDACIICPTSKTCVIAGQSGQCESVRRPG